MPAEDLNRVTETVQLKHDVLPDWLQQQFPRLHTRLPDFLRLTRLNRPIGTLLLLWPTVEVGS